MDMKDFTFIKKDGVKVSIEAKDKSSAKKQFEERYPNEIVTKKVIEGPKEDNERILKKVE